MIQDSKVYLVRATGVNALALSAAHTELSIHNGLAVSAIRHTYKNTSSASIDTQFSFPVNADMTISRLVVVSDSVEYEAQIVDKKEAEEKFVNAVASPGFQLNYDSRKDNIVVMNMGALEAAAELEIQMTVVQPLRVRFNQWYFSLAANFVPRVIDEVEELNLEFQNNQSPAKPEEETKTPTDCSSSLAVSIHASGDISYFDVPSHDVEGVEREGRTCTFSVTNSDDKNFELFYNYEGHERPQLLCQRSLQHSDQVALMLSFFPDFEGEDLASGTAEYVFLLDRSGSMSGSEIEIAKKVLASFLEALPSSSRFNVLSFGSNHEFMFGESQWVTEENIKLAVQRVRGFSANMGGTNIIEPMKAVFKSKSQLPLVIFTLTDGHVGNKDEVIREMYTHVAHSRVHTFGIGGGVDEALVKKLAIAGKGSYHLMKKADEQLQERVMLALERAKEPGMSNLVPTWPAKCILAGPSNEQTVFNHQPFVQLGVLQDQVDSDATVGLAGLETVSMGKVDFSTLVGDALELEYGTELFQFCGKRAITELELETNRDNKKILELSTKYSVLSSQTAYIAIELGDQADQADVKTLTLEVFGEEGQNVFASPKKSSQIFAQVPRNFQQPANNNNFFVNPPPQAGGGLFGNNNGAFGNNNNAGNIFNSNNVQGGLFGNNAAAGGGGLFGNNNMNMLAAPPAAFQAPAPKKPRRQPRAKKPKAQPTPPPAAAASPAAHTPKAQRAGRKPKQAVADAPKRAVSRSPRPGRKPKQAVDVPKRVASKSPQPDGRGKDKAVRVRVPVPVPVKRRAATPAKLAPAVAKPARKPLLGKRKAPGPANEGASVDIVLRSQAKDGSWDMSDELLDAAARLMEVDMIDLQFPGRGLRRIKGAAKLKVWATHIALWVLHAKTRGARAVQKAEKFLENFPAVDARLERLQ